MIGRSKIPTAIGAVLFLLFITLSSVIDFQPGRQIRGNFVEFSKQMLWIVPCAFILIGLFEVWIKKETVERHLGKESGARGYLWSVLLAGTTVGGLVVALPLSSTLYSKGARLSVIFMYLGAAAICRIPMTIFEASFVGIKFTLIRLIVSLPLVYLSSVILGNHLESRHFVIKRDE